MASLSLGLPQGVAAFVMPNAAIDPTTPLAAFIVPLEPLEAVAGGFFLYLAMIIIAKLCVALL